MTLAACCRPCFSVYHSGDDRPSKRLLVENGQRNAKRLSMKYRRFAKIRHQPSVCIVSQSLRNLVATSLRLPLAPLRESPILLGVGMKCYKHYWHRRCCSLFTGLVAIRRLLVRKRFGIHVLLRMANEFEVDSRFCSFVGKLGIC